MRIAWLTPFNESSAIGRVGLSICENLNSYAHEVSIIRTERDQGAVPTALKTRLPVRWWHDVDPTELAERFDVVVVNVGDNFQFHAGIFPFLSQLVCVGILHDFHIYGLFHGWLASLAEPELHHDRVVKTYYGEDQLAFARNARSGAATLEEISVRLPMLEWISSRCGGAMVHADFYRERVERACAGPVRMAYLSQKPRETLPLPSGDGEQVVVTTVGIINPNKCADAVVRAIGASDLLKARCHYRLVGRIDDVQRRRLSELAAGLNVTNFEIVGEVNEEAFDREMGRAEIVCCLRRPILEGASASVVEAMMSGRPAIVCNAGFYSELPDDCVVKIPRDFSDNDLMRALEILVRDPQGRHRIGGRARVWSVAECSTERYTSTLMELLTSFVASRPSQEMSRRLGDDLAKFGIGADDPAIGRIAGCMDELLNTGTK